MPGVAQRTARDAAILLCVALRKVPMLHKFSLLIVVLMAGSTPASAQLALPFPPLPMAQGTPEERAACGPDVRKFCEPALPDTMRVLACLQANRTRISSACNRVLVSHGQ